MIQGTIKTKELLIVKHILTLPTSRDQEFKERQLLIWFGSPCISRKILLMYNISMISILELATLLYETQNRPNPVLLLLIFEKSEIWIYFGGKQTCFESLLRGCVSELAVLSALAAETFRTLSRREDSNLTLFKN